MNHGDRAISGGEPLRTAQTRGSARDPILWSVTWIAAALCCLTFVASRFATRPPGAPPGARLLPRVPQAPATAGEVLRLLGVGSIVWYAAFASVPLFVFLSRRLPFEPRRRVASVAGHLAAIATLTLATAWLQWLITYRGAASAPPLESYLRLGLVTGTLPFLTAAAAAHAIVAVANAHARRLESERARAELAEWRLEALTAQLQPHFLFNTLQGISTLITRDPQTADAMLSDLSDLLRQVLRRGRAKEIELSEELRVLEPYLQISRRRFGERLSVRMAVEEAATRALVPFFVLQPLVENAMHHGVSTHAGPGEIEIAARRDDGRLILSVTDDGPGVVTADESRGIGLSNTSARLRVLYGETQSLELDRLPGRGFRARVTIPYREPARDAEAS